MRFYRDVLGFEVTGYGPAMGLPVAFLAAGDYHHILIGTTSSTKWRGERCKQLRCRKLIGYVFKQFGDWMVGKLHGKDAPTGQSHHVV